MYKHESREELDIKNNSIETQVGERAPLTTRLFHRICG